MLLRNNGNNKNNATTLSISGDGATITRLQKGEQDIFYPSRMAKNREGDLKPRGGCFIGAPVFGCPDKALLLGLPQHGTVRYATPHTYFKLDDHKARICFSSPGTVDEREIYPLDWFLDVTIEAEESGLKHEMSITPSSQTLPGTPFNAGIHPYFPAALGAVEIGTETIAFTDMEDTQKIEIPETGLVRVLLEFGTVIMKMEGYEWLNLWSDHGDKYFCVEPLWDHPSRWGTDEGNVIDGTTGEINLSCTFTFTEYS